MVTGAPKAGELLAQRYRLERELGHGKRGAVYRAHDERLGRDVAIKMLPGRAAAGEHPGAATLSHPGIVRMFDAGTWQDGSFIVMELVAGGTLAERGPLPPSEAVRLVAALADALDYARERGLAPDHLEPRDVLLTDEDQPKLLLGQARQALGDPRDDVRALGGLLVDTLAGAPAADLQNILERATAAEPDARFDSLVEFRQALLRAVDNTPGQAPTSRIPSLKPDGAVRPRLHDTSGSQPVQPQRPRPASQGSPASPGWQAGPRPWEWLAQARPWEWLRKPRPPASPRRQSKPPPRQSYPRSWAGKADGQRVAPLRPLAAGAALLVLVVTLLAVRPWSTSQTVVPDLGGKHISQLPALLEQSHLVIGQISTRPDAAHAGLVVAQQPAAGQRLSAGGRVDLVVGVPG
ncbi:MAG TPA: PASTA domain-containing protein [Chloroflexota bacterium]